MQTKSHRKERKEKIRRERWKGQAESQQTRSGERPERDLTRHLKLPYWPWQCRRLGYNGHVPDDLPRELYYVKHYYSKSNYPEDCDFKRRAKSKLSQLRPIKANCFHHLDEYTELLDP